MGLFKGMRDLQKQAQEISGSWDPAAQMAAAQQQMAATQDLMATQATAAQAAVNGGDAQATITAVRQGPGMVNHQPMVEFDLTVIREGQPPYPATITQVVPQIHLARAQAGATVAAKVDPENPNAIWLNWDAPSPS